MFTTNPFLNLIKCKICKSNFKQKKERGKIKYICTNYDRKGLKSKCCRIVLPEDQILYCINKHLNRTIGRSEIREVIKNIEVYRDKILINYKDNSQSKYSLNEIIF